MVHLSGTLDSRASHNKLLFFQILAFLLPFFLLEVGADIILACIVLISGCVHCDNFLFKSSYWISGTFIIGYHVLVDCLLNNQVKKKFGHQAEAFFVVLTAIQFHLLFYSSRPLPNIFALALGKHRSHCITKLKAVSIKFLSTTKM